MGKFVKAREYTEEVLPQLLTLYGTRHDMSFNALYDFYLLQLATNSFDNLKAVNAFEELLQQATCMDETWKVHPCRGYFELVRGIRYVCAVCPTESRWHCGNCFGKKPSAFCPHTDCHEFVPPARYIQEQRLHLLAKGQDWDKFNEHFHTYQAYCKQHNVQGAIHRLLSIGYGANV
ncbi:hypothetical protein AC1031_013797 [Aphanomyces cochlioides]|nr:hypothetical protein AC1031_013797 [Aphanomyces cochlioides]